LIGALRENRRDSMRIGAAQDMLVAGFDALAIMQEGGCKSANVVLRYVENASTKELHVRRWKAIGSGIPFVRG
jgi:integrase/recombinase XerD